MDIAVKERLIGAAVLVVIVVLVVPALLSGPPPPAEPLKPAADDTRVVEIDLTGKTDPRGEDSLPAEPEPAGTGPGDTLPVPPAVAGLESAAPAATAAPAASPAQVAVEQPKPAAAAPSPPPGWAVQVAALSKPDAANRVAQDLKKKGYTAFVVEHRAEGRVLYRVRVGPEADRAKAEAMARRLRDDGFKPAVVTQP
jgi:DedD protein